MKEPSAQSTISKLILAFEHPLSVGLALFAIIILVAAGNHLWIRWNDIPRPPSFWACLGMIFHWLATGTARFAELLQDDRKINVDVQHHIFTLALLFAFIAGVFYFRFLTLHINNWLWKLAAGILVAITMVLWMFEVTI